MSASLVIGPLQAYRCWRAEWQDGVPVLGSLFHSTTWPATGPLHAACEKRPGSLAAWIRRRFWGSTDTHVAPAWGCECGIYAMAALKEEPDLELSPHLYQRGPLDRVLRVAGVVQLWGRVVQHEHGYRAEFARPMRLLAIPSLVRERDQSLLDAIVRRYAVQIVSGLDDLSAAA